MTESQFGDDYSEFTLFARLRRAKEAVRELNSREKQLLTDLQKMNDENTALEDKVATEQNMTKGAVLKMAQRADKLMQKDATLESFCQVTGFDQHNLVRFLSQSLEKHATRQLALENTISKLTKHHVRKEMLHEAELLEKYAKEEEHLEKDLSSAINTNGRLGEVLNMKKKQLETKAPEHKKQVKVQIKQEKNVNEEPKRKKNKTAKKIKMKSTKLKTKNCNE